MENSFLVILLGASKWDFWEDLNLKLSEHNAYLESANKIKDIFSNEKCIKVNRRNVLDLFDSPADSIEQNKEILDFVKNRERNIDSLLIYYIGHGERNDSSGNFHLAIRNSDPQIKSATCLNSKVIAETIDEVALHLKCFFIIDCCFSGAFVDAFHACSARDISLLCSADRNKTSEILPESKPYTVFTGAVISALTEGDIEYSSRFSLKELYVYVNKYIKSKYKKEVALSHVASPAQSGGHDIIDLPIFLNQALESDLDYGFFEKNINIQCFVVESMTEHYFGKNYKLHTYVYDALQNCKGTLEKITSREVDAKPTVIKADSVFKNRESLDNVISALCLAEIVVFDLTNYEPVIMMMLGIRSVVRRGVTIASIGDDYFLGGALEYPFNIKDVNIISHSNKQVTLKNPLYLISEKILSGFEELQFHSGYLDLPVFDAIRTLPSNKEQRAPREYCDQVLVLCPFDNAYTNNNWLSHIKPKLGIYLPKDIKNNPPSIVRTLDMSSPRLVTQSLYESIRLTQMCIVDWTSWKPNVFFELGVRLSSSDIDPVCIYDSESADLRGNDFFESDLINEKSKFDKLKISDLRDKIIYCQKFFLIRNFKPIKYETKASGSGLRNSFDYESMIDRFNDSIEKNDISYEYKLPFSYFFSRISESIDVNSEFENITPERELLKAADLLEDPQSDSIGRSSVLYPKNDALLEKASKRSLELRLAAWFYMENRLHDKINSSDKMLSDFIDLGNLISRSLLQYPDGKQLALQIRNKVKMFDI